MLTLSFYEHSFTHFGLENVDKLTYIKKNFQTEKPFHVRSIDKYAAVSEIHFSKRSPKHWITDVASVPKLCFSCIKLLIDQDKLLFWSRAQVRLPVYSHSCLKRNSF